MYTWDVLKDTVKQAKMLLTITEPCLNQEFPQEELKNYHARKIWVSLRGPTIWRGMPGNVWNDIVSWQAGQLFNSTKYQLHALTTIISRKNNWNPWENCQKYALRLFWNAYTWHVLEDLIFHGQWINLHDQSQNGQKHVTNDYVVWSLTFIIHMNTNSIHVRNTAKQCRSGLFFKTPILQEIFRIQNLHQVEHYAFLKVIHLFQLLGCVRNKLQFRTVQQNQKSFLWMQDWGWMVSPHLMYGIWSSQFFTETRIRMIKFGETRLNLQRERKSMEQLTFWTMLILFPQTWILLVRKLCWKKIFEDNEALIKMIIKGRSPTMRHVSRSQRVALDWLFDRINLDPKIQIKYIDTKDQLADILTKGNFTRDECNHLLCVFNISHLSPTNCSEVMSKRTPKDSGEERVTVKSKPMMNLVSRCSERTPDVLASTASERTGKTRYESQLPLSSWNEHHQRTDRETCFGRLLINLLRVECWQELVFFKSGNLMNWWK